MDFSSKTFSMLLVENNDADIQLIKEAFKDCAYIDHFIIVKDGEEALDFLYNNGGNSANLKPNLIILDIKLPKKSGFDVLSEIKSNPDFNKIPVVVFSNSDSEEDILKSYTLKANSYIIKPSDLNEFAVTAKTICEFWLETVKLPLN